MHALAVCTIVHARVPKARPNIQEARVQISFGIKHFIFLWKVSLHFMRPRTKELLCTSWCAVCYARHPRVHGGSVQLRQPGKRTAAANLVQPWTNFVAHGSI
jgi:hypothetical protein